jgi:hypothetical protein
MLTEAAKDISTLVERGYSLHYKQSDQMDVYHMTLVTYTSYNSKEEIN